MSVLSFRKSFSELDQFVEQRRILRDLLSHCVETVAQYPVEIREGDAAALQRNLEKLAARAEGCELLTDANQFHADLRGELRSYRDTAQAEVRQLQADIATAWESVHTFIGTVTSSSSEHEQTLRDEFEILEKAAASGNLDAIRAAIRTAIDAALRSCEEIRRSQDLVIAQLRDELRALHREVDQERHAAALDSTGVFNRARLDARIKDLLLLNDTFAVLLIGIPNAAELARQDARLLPECLRAVAGRIQTLFRNSGEHAVLGRWSENTFAIVLNLPLPSAPVSVADLAGKLSGAYAVQLDGASHTANLTVHADAVEHSKGGSEGTFYLQLGQAAFSVVMK